MVDMSLNSDIFFWFRANQSLLFLLNAARLAEMTRLGREPTIYRTRGEHANHYTTDAAEMRWSCECSTQIIPRCPKSKRKIVEAEAKLIPSKHNHYRPIYRILLKAKFYYCTMSRLCYASRAQPKTIKMICVASSSSTQH